MRFTPSRIKNFSLKRLALSGFLLLSFFSSFMARAVNLENLSRTEGFSSVSICEASLDDAVTRLLGTVSVEKLLREIVGSFAPHPAVVLSFLTSDLAVGSLFEQAARHDIHFAWRNMSSHEGPNSLGSQDSQNSGEPMRLSLIATGSNASLRKFLQGVMASGETKILLGEFIQLNADDEAFLASIVNVDNFSLEALLREWSGAHNGSQMVRHKSNGVLMVINASETSAVAQDAESTPATSLSTASVLGLGSAQQWAHRADLMQRFGITYKVRVNSHTTLTIRSANRAQELEQRLLQAALSHLLIRLQARRTQVSAAPVEQVVVEESVPVAAPPLAQVLEPAAIEAAIASPTVEHAATETAIVAPIIVSSTPVESTVAEPAPAAATLDVEAPVVSEAESNPANLSDAQQEAASHADTPTIHNESGPTVAPTEPTAPTAAPSATSRPLSWDEIRRYVSQGAPQAPTVEVKTKREKPPRPPKIRANVRASTDTATAVGAAPTVRSSNQSLVDMIVRRLQGSNPSIKNVIFTEGFLATFPHQDADNFTEMLEGLGRASDMIFAQSTGHLSNKEDQEAIIMTRSISYRLFYRPIEGGKVLILAFTRQTSVRKEVAIIQSLLAGISVSQDELPPDLIEMLLEYFRQQDAEAQKRQSLGQFDAGIYRDAEARRALQGLDSYYALLDLVKKYRDTETVLYEHPDLAEVASTELTDFAERIKTTALNLRSLARPASAENKDTLTVEFQSEDTYNSDVLFDFYRRYFRENHWDYQVLQETRYEGTNHLKTLVLRLTGQGALYFLGFESGVHRFRSKSGRASDDRIHTHVVKVLVMSESDSAPTAAVRSSEELFPESEFRFEITRGSGNGGQKRNKVETAVDAIHIPTGTRAHCERNRSQDQNKKDALADVREKLFAQWQATEERSFAERRRAQLGSGSQNSRFRNYDFVDGVIKDERTDVVRTADQLRSEGGFRTFHEAIESQNLIERLRGLIGRP